MAAASGDSTDGPAKGLVQSLLLDPLPAHLDPPRAPGGWSRWLWAAFVSAFVTYHSLALLLYNTPRKGLGAKIHTLFNPLYTRRYLRAIGSVQGWAMFAPNPYRSNIFMRILVIDEHGEVWDMNADIHGVARHPYLVYDRLGKINRRIVEETTYQKHMGAWICRDWERSHGGQPAKSVRFVKKWTEIPRAPIPWRLPRPRSFDPGKLEVHQLEHDTFDCAKLFHGQLPDDLRERYGLREKSKTKFRPVRISTWYKRQQIDERRKRRERERGDVQAPVEPP